MNNINIDFVRGICFTKTTLGEEEKIVWDTRQWGYIRLTDPEIIDTLGG